MDRIITFIKGIKEIVGNLPGKWQSRNSNYKNTYMVAGIFILLSGICRFYLLFASSGKEYIDIIVKFVFAYLGLLLFIISVTMLVWGFYINNSIKIFEKAGHIFLLLSLIISMLAFLAAIPAIVTYIVFQFIIDKRAKKVENFINFLLVLAILLIAFIFLLVPNLTFSMWVVNFIGILIANKVQINVVSCMLFLLITLCVLESFLECFILLLIIKHRQNKKENLANSKNPIEDIGEQEKINKRDREYLWNGIKRIWLFILVVGFAAFTFIVVEIEGIEGYSAEIKNVLTIYTLILLYLDKRKQWN